MLAKITSKHQVTIPKQFMEQFKDVEYFDLALKDGLLLLKPNLRIRNLKRSELKSKGSD
ncbi:MAG TPA: AbrB family transcriptional regulator [Desulfobacteraceae bacterium]|nr:AbrB family transcriptional regulator [Desulfobacteraceae bacterium]